MRFYQIRNPKNTHVQKGLRTKRRETHPYRLSKTQRTDISAERIYTESSFFCVSAYSDRANKKAFSDPYPRQALSHREKSRRKEEKNNSCDRISISKALPFSIPIVRLAMSDDKYSRCKESACSEIKLPIPKKNHLHRKKPFIQGYDKGLFFVHFRSSFSEKVYSDPQKRQTAVNSLGFPSASCSQSMRSISLFASERIFFSMRSAEQSQR